MSDNMAARRDELVQRALEFTDPFTISQVGDGGSYHLAADVLRDLLERGDLRVVSGRSVPVQYEWVE